MSEPRFTLGIDLGTTHTALAFTRLDDRAVDRVDVFEFGIPQVVAPSEVDELPLLPSFVYLATQAERESDVHALPWEAATGRVVGEFARGAGSTIPSRVVSSAKSWLAHPDVDPREATLPLEATDDVARVSPLEASALYLAHVRDAWNAAFPAAPFEEQEITITVPASFDPAARELTAEAARSVGARELVLLEEPQAALYAFLVDHKETFRASLAAGDVILVVDVGGGTTDFSLIALHDEAGQLVPERIAVGEHILLGGDNMDLALAARVEARLAAEGHALDAFQRRSLVLACQRAKEQLLSSALDEVTVVVPSRGARLVGGSLRASLHRDEVETLLVDGFFPIVDADARPRTRARVGLRTLGLPYADDAAITRHLAAFLSRQRAASTATPSAFVSPTVVLFNGGVFKAEPMRARIVDVLSRWAAAAGAPAPRVLEGADLDRAVARGAAYYAFVRRRGGLRIRSGLAKSFYVGVESALPAIPGLEPPLRALCVAPYGLEEGEPPEPVPMELGLVVGEPVRFRFFSSATRRQDVVGTLLETISPDELEELGEIASSLPAEGRREGDVVPVRLEARVDELGTLELAARPRTGDERWKVSLDVRGAG